MNTDRRTLIRTALWSVPAVSLAATAPAYATSAPAPAPPHTCSVKACLPTVECRKVKHPSGATWFEYRVTRSCVWSEVEATYFDRAFRPTMPVVWTPFPAPGQPFASRTDSVRVTRVETF